MPVAWMPRSMAPSAAHPRQLARLFEGKPWLTVYVGTCCHLHFGRIATARKPSPALKTRASRRTGVEPYDGAGREERAAEAGSVATRNDAVYPCGLGGDPPASIPPGNDRDAPVCGREGRLHRDGRRPRYASRGCDDRR